jgi:hypothetical protein
MQGSAAFSASAIAAFSSGATLALWTLICAKNCPRWAAAQSAATTPIEKGCTRLDINFLGRHEFYRKELALGIQARNTERAA